MQLMCFNAIVTNQQMCYLEVISLVMLTRTTHLENLACCIGFLRKEIKKVTIVQGLLEIHLTIGINDANVYT